MRGDVIRPRRRCLNTDGSLIPGVYNEQEFKELVQTSYPLGLPGPGTGGFQVTLISDEDML